MQGGKQKNGAPTTGAEKKKTPQVDLIASDYTRLYAAVLHSTSSSPDRKHENFLQEWDRLQIERMHYAGASIPKHRFHPHVVKQLLNVATGFLSLPASCTPPEALEFGIELLYQLYFTQPIDKKKSVDEQRQRIVLDIATAENLQHDISLRIHQETQMGSGNGTQQQNKNKKYNVFLGELLSELENDDAFLIVPHVEQQQKAIGAVVSAIPDIIRHASTSNFITNQQQVKKSDVSGGDDDDDALFGKLSEYEKLVDGTL